MGFDTKRQTGEEGRHPLEARRALPIALLRARETVMLYFRPMLTRHGVTEQQWRVLRLLAEEGRLDLTAVSERALILAPSLSRIVRSLEQKKMIVRTRDRADGRRSHLSLTERGRAFVAEITPESLAIYAALEKQFGKDRIGHLLDMLNDLADLPSGKTED